MLRNVWLKLILTACLAVALGACNRTTTPDPGARYYEVRGIVRGLAPDRRSLDVEHEDIRGFMPSMTMTFSVHNPKEIAGLHSGDAISFRMVVTDQDLSLERVKKIAAEDLHLPPHTPSPTPAASPVSRLREGDELPSFALTGQNGESLTNESFRGRSLILTFIFTRCAVPNFCPRMSSNFAELQKAIQDGEIPDTHLLSISLDPGFDTPDILRQYGDHLGADSKIWTLATGHVEGLLSAFSVYRQTEGGTISHGLATALVNRDGRIVQIWRGNGWTPADVVEATRGLTKPGASN